MHFAPKTKAKMSDVRKNCKMFGQLVSSTQKCRGAEKC